MSAIEEFVIQYIVPESLSAAISYESNSYIPWICAVFGAFLVGLSGVVPLFLLPDTTPKKATPKFQSKSGKSYESHPSREEHKKLYRRLSRQESHVAQIDVVGEEEPLNRYLSFAVGGLLGDICLHLLPEIYSVKKDSSLIYDEDHQVRLGLSILTGILSFLAIEKLFDFTQVNIKSMQIY